MRFTDQDVVLVRTDLMPQLALSNIQMHQFKNLSALAVPGGSISILRDWNFGWTRMFKAILRFTTTHLETSADPVTQLKQANELAQALNSSLDNPSIVLCDDFSATQIDLIGNQISPACQNRQKSMRKSMAFAML